MRSRYVGPGSLEAVAEPLPGERAGEVVIYIGEVDARTASRFLSRVAESTDQTIELRVLIKPSTGSEFQASGYLALHHDGQLNVSLIDRKHGSGGTEVVTNGPVRWSSGRYLTEGSFAVVPGGMHQGVLCFALEPRANAPHRVTRLVERPF
jgi:hypothetical protein